MKAILLAAGFGTRLRPLTDNIPKCLVPINDQPLLDIWLEYLTKAGIGPFLINTHYLHEKVESYIKASRYKDQVTIVYEEQLLGTAGTLRSNSAFFNNEDGMLVHADNYCIADVHSFLETHQKANKDSLLTMMSFQTTTPQSCGILELNSEGVVIAFHEKVASPPGNLANGAVYILKNELIEKIAKGTYSDFSKEVIPELMGRIQNFENKGIHIDIGTPESYSMAQRFNK
jgi:mannose-1-phosphate guanylyltransferase